MSLQVWLPLNGDLHNQGLSSQTVNITTTPIWATPGKLGNKSLYTKTRMTTMNFPGLIGVSTYSVAYWLYIPTEIAPTAWSDMFGIAFNCAGTVIYERDERRAATTTGRHNYHLAKSSSEGSNTNPYYGTQENDNANNNWVHYVLVKDDISARLYENGKLIVTIPKMNFENTKRTMTGAVYLGDNGCESYLQDFRIYDHALSNKEIEEISKGLVLHYKLDGNGKGNDNILLNTHFDNRYTQTSGWDTTKNGTLLANSWGGYNSGVSNQATVYHAHLKEFEGQYVYEYIKTANETWLGISQGGLQTKLIAGQTYTFSWEEYHVDGTNRVGTGLYYYKTGATSANFHLGIQQASNITRVIGQWQKYSYTFVAPNDADYSKSISWYIYGHYNNNGTFYMRHPKLELNDSATIWTPNSNDPIYSLYNNNNIIYDSSGYNNNGTIVSSLKATTPSPRYNYAVLFNGSSSAIKILENKWMAQHATEMTINIWVKNSSWSNGANMKFFSCTESGGFNCEAGNSGYVRFPIYVCTNAEQTTYAYKYDSKEIQASALTANEWNMITFVYNSTGTKTYINGQLHHTYTNTSYGIHFNTNARLFLGCEAATANPSTPYYNGQMSDFRLYYTTLTDSQIKELYNTSATIDNKGNIHAKEYLENNNLSINKQGQFQENILVDNNDLTQASILKTNKQIQGFTVYEY